MVVEFGLKSYTLPKGYLVPRVPQRLLYLDWIMSLFKLSGLEPPKSGFDIGVGANAIYCLLGHLKFDLKMTGSDTNPASLTHARTQILEPNNLTSEITLVEQPNHLKVLENVLTEPVDFTICNPPFFASPDERTERKSSVCPIADSEEWTKDGEIGFLQRYAWESVQYAGQVRWFTSMCGKKHTWLWIQTYLREMVDRGQFDIVIAADELNLGHSKRWVLAWQFIEFSAK